MLCAQGGKGPAGLHLQQVRLNRLLLHLTLRSPQGQGLPRHGHQPQVLLPLSRLLRDNNIRICVEAQGAYGDEDENYKLIAKPGEPEILVLERIKRTRSKE